MLYQYGHTPKRKDIICCCKYEFDIRLSYHKAKIPSLMHSECFSVPGKYVCLELVNVEG